MTGFQHAIAGGSGDLDVTSLHSPDYVAGVSGWSIDKDGNAEFNSIILPPGTGTTVTFSGTAPGSPAAGDLWYNTSSGNELSQWNGSAWVAYQIGTGAITPGSITASLIQANTITASQLAAGIVYAGIINGTTVNAVTFNGSTFNTTDGMLDADGLLLYSSTPAAGNLVVSISQNSGTDTYGNAYLPGYVTYQPAFGGSYLATQVYQGSMAFYESVTYYGWISLGASITITTGGEIELQGSGVQLPSGSINGYAVDFAFLSTLGLMSNVSNAPYSGVGTLSNPPTAAEYNDLNDAYHDCVDSVNSILSELQTKGYMS